MPNNSRVVNGTYPGAPDLATLAGEKDLDMGDLDKDGDLDIVVAMKPSFSLTTGLSNVLLLNDGASFVDFTDKTDFGLFASASRDVEIFDADGDGWLDVMFANTGVLHDNPASADSQPRLHKNLGLDGSGHWLGLREVPRSQWLDFHLYDAPFPGGTLVASLPYMDPAPRFCSVTSGDVDGDGLDDLFFVDYINNLGHRYLVNESTPGNFRFVDRTDEPGGVLDGLTLAEVADSHLGRKVAVLANFTTGAEMADLNGDGWLELVYFTDQTNGGGKILFSKAGQFHALFERPVAGTYSGELVDFNGDGRVDVYFGSDNCDKIQANKPFPGPGSEDEFYLGLGPPLLPGSGIADEFLTGPPAGCIHAADLDRDGLPDVGVSDVDASNLSGQCGSVGDTTFLILINTTPDPSPGQEFADPDSCALAIHGRTGTTTGGCTLTYTSIQPWNVDGVYDFEFIDLDKDGFQDILMGTCSGFEFWTMEGFESALNYCEAVPNSTGEAAKIGWSGSLSLGANNFNMSVQGGTLGQTAQFFYGPTQVDVPFGDGLRCVGGSLQRLATFSLDGTGAGVQQFDFTQPPANSGAGQIHAGESWNIQCFYRDSASLGAQFNYSDALSVYFAS